MTTIQAFDLVFPLMGCRSKPDEPTVPVIERDIYGTAFSIGGGLLLTAGHSLRGAAEHDMVCVGLASEGIWKAVLVKEHEIIHSHDIGVLRAPIPEGSELPWVTSELDMLASVQTVGFPYALDRNQGTINIRAFRGNLVSARTFLEFPAHPRVYELPFALPRGLSGAPVFTTETKPQLAGLVVGNAATDMVVLRDIETSEDGTTTIVQQIERLQLGIALQAASLLNIESELVGQDLRKHLELHALL